jgi:hypothetical protein
MGVREGLRERLREEGGISGEGVIVVLLWLLSRRMLRICCAYVVYMLCICCACVLMGK